jgi:serine/threonine protein kinase
MNSDVSNPVDTPTLMGERDKAVRPRKVERKPVFPTVEGYEILDELGRGGMGVVYKAKQIALKRLVALKMIRSGIYAGETDIARFQAEAEAAARLQHPNIVQIYEIGTHEQQPFFALEYVEGGTLSGYLEGKPQPEREAARLMESIARAIHFAHQRGVLHRDLKPANILLGAATRRGSEPRRPSTITGVPSARSTSST